MRRGQILSLDALMATVLVIMLLSVVSATSDNLRAGITDMINWYDRASVPDTMLDVLLNSPGEPANWSDNSSSVIKPGLRASNGYYVDYDKLVSLITLVKNNDSGVVGFLENLSLGKDFQLEVFLKERTLKASLDYVVKTVNWSSACNIKQIVEEYGNPADEPIYLDCSGGTARFTHYDRDEVSFYTFVNYESICVNGTMYVGDNFDVISGDYVGVSEDLKVKVDGSLNASEIYVGGDATFEKSTYVHSSGDFTVGGELDVKSSGHGTIEGSAYLYDTVEIGSSGYLSVGGDFYAKGPLLIHSDGHLTVDGSTYVDDYVSAESSAYLNIGEDFYIDGDLRTDYRAEVNVGGEFYVNGDAIIKGSVNASAMYVDGSFSLDSGSTGTIHGDLYVNGDLKVSGVLLVDGNLYVNGDISVESQGSIYVIYVKKNLYYTGLIVKGAQNIRADGKIRRVSDLPWDESKLDIDVEIPPMKPSPCELSARGSFQVIVGNVTIGYDYTSDCFEPGWNGFAIVNGTVLPNTDPLVKESRERSTWISHAERKVVVDKFVYNGVYVLTKGTTNFELYSGRLSANLLPSSTLKIPIPQEDGNVSIISLFGNDTMSGYSVMAIVKNENTVLYSIQKTVFTGNTSITKTCPLARVENGTFIVPWACIIEPVSGVAFSVVVYDVGFPNVTVMDSGNIEMYMEPVFVIGKVKLWVWDES